jgi:hypothetical protein
VDLSDAADELYAVAPEEFVAARRRLAAEAKKAGDGELAKRIGAMRRPTVSAWAVNRLARSAPEELGWLSDLGADLRTAWASGGHVGGLDQRRGELIGLLGRTARSLAEEAGRPLGEAAVREVEDTLHAATMDPAVADEVRSGRLTRPRSHAGFAPAGGFAAKGDGSGGGGARPVAARPADEAGERRREREERPERERRRRSAERARAAEAEARDAEQALAEREAEVGAAERAHADLTEEAERLRRRLAAVLDRRAAAVERLRTAERERDRAAGRAEEARRRSEEAHRTL